MGTLGCFLGFDFGMKRIGVAVGQRVTGTASPLKTLSAKEGVPDWVEIQRMIKAWDPEGLVVGLPVNMDGSEGEMTSKAQKFINRLKERTRLPVYAMDERLTTRAVRYELERLDQPYTGKDDALAACIILEDYLTQIPSA
jgi:putative holliday junction resolvase